MKGCRQCIPPARDSESDPEQRKLRRSMEAPPQSVIVEEDGAMPGQVRSTTRAAGATRFAALTPFSADCFVV